MNWKRHTEGQDNDPWGTWNSQTWNQRLSQMKRGATHAARAAHRAAKRAAKKAAHHAGESKTKIHQRLRATGKKLKGLYKEVKRYWKHGQCRHRHSCKRSRDHSGDNKGGRGKGKRWTSSDDDDTTDLVKDTIRDNPPRPVGQRAEWKHGEQPTGLEALLMGMRTRALRDYMTANQIACEHCVEKRELIQAIVAASGSNHDAPVDAQREIRQKHHELHEKKSELLHEQTVMEARKQEASDVATQTTDDAADVAQLLERTQQLEESVEALRPQNRNHVPAQHGMPLLHWCLISLVSGLCVLLLAVRLVVHKRSQVNLPTAL